MSFKLKLHHGGFFQRDRVMQYASTSFSVSIIDIDFDKWSFFEAIGILKEDFGCVCVCGCVAVCLCVCVCLYVC